MLTIRKAHDRGHFDFGWLDTRHTFSFGEYHDPRHMGFRALRVINEDVVRGGRGFGTHPHRDMEIVTYVLEGALAHKDSMGNGSVIRPDDVQRMSAGTGVTHSEHNASATTPVHLLQIWLLPATTGTPPSYEQRTFGRDEKLGRLRLVGAPDGRDGSVTIHQDVALYATVLEPGMRVTHALAPGRYAWVQIAHGRIAANGTTLAAGDGAAVSDERTLAIVAAEPSELLLFDLA
ncbi:MAG: pirin family protein [Deltaproteobacteria bacterium]|nr:pirin family protein [Deltaproteobacteria bacterium]